MAAWWPYRKHHGRRVGNPLPWEWRRCGEWTVFGDAQVYVLKGLWVLAASKDLTLLSRITLGGKVYASPVVANGTLYLATTTGWLWVVSQR